MTATPVPIALRAFTMRTAIEDASSATLALDAPIGQKKPPRSRQIQPAWPGRVLVFDTETTTDASQRLLFGCYRVLRWLPSGGLTLIQEGLFHADDLEDWDRAGQRELNDYAAIRQSGSCLQYIRVSQEVKRAERFSFPLKLHPLLDIV